MGISLKDYLKHEVYGCERAFILDLSLQFSILMDSFQNLVDGFSWVNVQK